MRTREDFDSFYRNELRHVLGDLEARRRAALRHTAAAAGIGMAIAAGLVLLSSAQHQISLVIGIVIALVLTGVTAAATMSGFRADFKHRIVRKIVKFCDPALTYSPGRGISESTFRRSDLFQRTPDRYRSEDLVKGSIGATSIEFSEVDAEYETRSRDSKGNTRRTYHAIFDGLFFVADFNKHFRTKTVVLPDVAERSLGRFGKWLQSKNFARADLVHLEDPEFEREFVVYGEDQVEARYILSPALMRRILDFKRRTRSEVHISFVASNVYVAVSKSRDLFEPRMFRSLLDPAMCREYLDDLELAIGIVEDLDLNTRIWTKE